MLKSSSLLPPLPHTGSWNPDVPLQHAHLTLLVFKSYGHHCGHWSQITWLGIHSCAAQRYRREAQAVQLPPHSLHATAAYNVHWLECCISGNLGMSINNQYKSPFSPKTAHWHHPSAHSWSLWSQLLEILFGTSHIFKKEKKEGQFFLYHTPYKIIKDNKDYKRSIS